MDFLRNESAISNSSLLVVGILLILALAGLVGIIVYLYNRLKDSRASKYGFGGKTLYSALAVLIMAAVIPIVLLSPSTEIRRSADSIDDVAISLTQSNTDDKEVQMIFTPLHEDRVYTGEYDIVIKISGRENISFDRFDERNDTTLEIRLEEGTYDLEVSITLADGNMFSKQDSIEVQ